MAIILTQAELVAMPQTIRIADTNNDENAMVSRLELLQ